MPTVIGAGQVGWFMFRGRELENVNADMGVVIPHGAPFPGENSGGAEAGLVTITKSHPCGGSEDWSAMDFSSGSCAGSTRYENRIAGPIELARTGTRLIPQTRVAERRASPLQLYLPTLPSSSRGTTRPPTPIEGSLSAS